MLTQNSLNEILLRSYETACATKNQIILRENRDSPAYNLIWKPHRVNTPQLAVGNYYLTNKMAGFHLLEILIVISIMSILMIIAMPNYSHYLIHERRLEAENILSKLAIAMEEYYLENNTYQHANLTTLNFPEQIVKNNYYLQIKMANAYDYLLFAQPINDQAKKDLVCATLTLDAKGKKSMTGTGNVNDCW